MNEAFLILAMATVTFVPRLLPFALASRLKLPKFMQQALSYVPIAILTVIIVQSIFYRDQVLAVNITNPFLGASVVAFLTALLQKRLFVTILMGLLSYVVLKFYLIV